MKEPLTIALIYDFDGTLAPGNMQEYDFIPAVGKSNKEFWHDANFEGAGKSFPCPPEANGGAARCAKTTHPTQTQPQ